jgi:hypothetical protein
LGRRGRKLRVHVELSDADLDRRRRHCRARFGRGYRTADLVGRSATAMERTSRPSRPNCEATRRGRASPHPTAARSEAHCGRRWTRLRTAHAACKVAWAAPSKTNSALVGVSRPKELPFLEGRCDMRPSDSAEILGGFSGKRLAAVARTNHSSARSHRLKYFVAQIEVVEESGGCMHAGNPEDRLAEGGV